MIPEGPQDLPGYSHAFSLLYPINLPQSIPCGDWALTCSAASPLPVALYTVPVRQAGALPSPSFRFHLAMDTRGFGYILPTTWWIRPFHRLERALAGRTMKRPCISMQGRFNLYCKFLVHFRRLFNQLHREYILCLQFHSGTYSEISPNSLM